jgi:lysozyme family protein
MWPGVVILGAGSGGVTAQVVAMATEEATPVHWLVLTVMVLIVLSGLGVFLTAKRHRGEAP